MKKIYTIILIFLSFNSYGTTLEVATYAGGCFWCTESDLEKVNGVIDSVSGYSGGAKVNPSYELVSSGTTNHPARQPVKPKYLEKLLITNT